VSILRNSSQQTASSPPPPETVVIARDLLKCELKGTRLTVLLWGLGGFSGADYLEKTADGLAFYWYCKTRPRFHLGDSRLGVILSACPLPASNAAIAAAIAYLLLEDTTTQPSPRMSSCLQVRYIRRECGHRRSENGRLVAQCRARRRFHHRCRTQAVSSRKRCGCRVNRGWVTAGNLSAIQGLLCRVGLNMTIWVPSNFVHRETADGRNPPDCFRRPLGARGTS